MQPCSREMQGLNSLFSNNHTQNQHQHQHQHQQQIQMNHQLDHLDPTSHDDFLKDMLSTLPPSSTSSSSWNLDPNQKPFWGDLNPPSNSDETAPSAVDNVVFPYDEHASLASKFRDHQISAASSPLTAKAAALMLQQQLLMSRGAAADSGILQMFDSSRNDVVDGSSSFKSPNPAGDDSVQALYNGFAGSLHGASLASNQTHHFQQPQGQGGSNPMQGQGQGQSFGGSGGGANQAPGGGNPGQPKQRVRARRGQATDPHSIAERLRRERIAERMKALQELVPNANKTDKASMLDEIIDYVKFLQLQVKVLSMSRLGGAAAVAPLVADITSEGGGSDCVQANANGGAHPRNSNGNQTTAASSSNDSLTMTEQQVAKLMEEDMGSAMQYLQGKGLCLMPISLATAISTATCHARNPLINNQPTPVIASNGDGPSSPGMSVLTVQSGTVGNGDAVKDAASISKP